MRSCFVYVISYACLALPFNVSDAAATTLSDGLYQIGNSLTRDARLGTAKHHIRSSSVLRQIREDTIVDEENVSDSGWNQDLLSFDGTLWLQPWGKPNVGHNLTNDIDDILFFVQYAGVDTLLLYQPAPPKNQLDNWLDSWNPSAGPQYRQAYYQAIADAVEPLLPDVDITWVHGGDLFYSLWDSGTYELEQLYRDELHATHDVGRVVLQELAQKVWESAVMVPEPTTFFYVLITGGYVCLTARFRP